MKIKFWTVCFNGGDGSAYVQTYTDKKKAEKDDDEHCESGEGFAESSLQEHNIQVGGTWKFTKR